MAHFTRRGIGKAAGAVAALGVGGAGAVSARPGVGPSQAPSRSFPPGFVWGCATAAYQIEGGVGEDGRGESIWDRFAHTPGRIIDGTTGDIACYSYRRYAEDRALVQGVGARAYRFSIAWPRIFPAGRGNPNPAGIDHYSRVVDDLLAAGIEPYVTLFHWDLPTALPGGWQSRDTALAFADYAGTVARALGDRVQHFVTLNEIRSFIDLGYRAGIHAPGLRLPPAELNQARHNALLAHGLGVQSIRANAPRGVQVGIAENATVAMPVIETPEHIAAARTAMRAVNAPFLTAILEGRYLDSYLAAEQGAGPQVGPGDMAAIASPLDFVALNIYTGDYVRAADTAPFYVTVPAPASFPTMSLPWLRPTPESLYWGVRFASELWQPRALYITENGCAADDAVVGGRIDDTDRIMYLRNYLTQLHRAAAEGYPIQGYFLWSLMDNFEWAEGYTKRFGIHHVDFTTGVRTPKLSAAWYRELIARNGLV